MNLTGWLKKIGGYAPDIALAIATGGTSAIATTALRIAAKELTGDETASIEEVEKAAEAATPAQLLALKQCNNDFIVKKLEIQAGEMASAREMYGKHNEQADKIADNVMKYNILYAVVIALAQIAALSFVDGMSDAVIVVIGNVCGWIIKGVLDERKDVTGFYFGSSIGSKAKDK